MKLTDLKQALKDLGLEYSKIKDLPAEERKAFGQEINRRKNEILAQIGVAVSILSWLNLTK